MKFFHRNKRNPLPDLTGLTIDFTQPRWGHNFSILDANTDGVYRIFCWVTPRPVPGDLIKWETSYGYCYLIVKKVRWTVNVDDMYECELQVFDREVVTYATQ